MTISPQPVGRPEDHPGRDTAPSGPAPSDPAASAPAASAPVQPAPAPTGPAPSASAPEPRVLPDPRGGLLGGLELRPVSEKLIPARYLANLFWYAVGLALLAGGVVLYALLGWWWPVFPAVLIIVLIVQSLLLTPRRVRAIGYLDGEEDLVVASGVMFREVHTIPYGRVQSVKIDEGPVDRRYGLAKISLSTAAAGTDVSLPGLPRDEAERLRELLSDRGVATMAAL